MTDTTDQAVEPATADANVTPEPVEAVEPPTPEPNDSDSSTEAADESKPERKPPGVHARIGELTKNWRETERDRDYWRDLALQYTRQTPAPQPEPPQPTAPEPDKTLADFNYDEAQYTAYTRKLAAEEARRAATDVLRQEREREAAQRKEQTFKQRIADFKKAAPDFDDLVIRNRSLPITEAMAEVIADSEDGPAVAYYLGKNPEAAAAIAQLPPNAAARELGKIEARLAFEREQARKPAPATPAVSKAPPPPPKIEAVEESMPVRTTDSSGDSLPIERWVELERKRLAKMNKRA
jgi:hypothetical protein